VTSTDQKPLDTLKQFLRDTPAGLTAADPEYWPGMFDDRLAFEDWRERWLAYWAGLARGATDPQEFAALRARLYAHSRTTRVDRFHT
jgi:hypothetical protein